MELWINIMKPKHIGKIFKSNNCGDFVALEYLGKARYRIRFLDTGYETDVKNSRMLDGGVVDKLKPSVCGVGFVGDGHYNPKKNYDAYKKWYDMMSRVYMWYKNKNNKAYRSCSVCKEWHNFQNFAKWYEDNYPNDGDTYDLDKDKKSNGEKFYSPETCSFISHTENTQISNSKEHHLYHPSHGIVNVFNLSEFMRSNNLSYAPPKRSKLPKKQRAWLRVTEDLYRKLQEQQSQ